MQFWDIHNHLLPGIDDGASCIDETFELIKEEYNQGVRSIIFTPHYRRGVFEVDVAARRTAFEDVVALYKMHYKTIMPGMHFYLGCEFYVPHAKVELLQSSAYRLLGGRIILTEFSIRDDYQTIVDAVDELVNAGFICVIAHVERYRLSFEDICNLRKRRNVFIQINAGSVLGKEGIRKKLLVHKLLRKSEVDFVGSDGHDTQDRPILIEDCAEMIQRKYGKEKVKELFQDTPQKVFLEGKKREV